MKKLIESGAARIAAGIQRVGANFDFEVLSLPGGSVIAAATLVTTASWGTRRAAITASNKLGYLLDDVR